MRPATVHLLAQLIRHARGAVTSIDQWARATPAGQVHVETERVVTFMRRQLASAERDLGGTSEDNLSGTAPQSTVDCAADKPHRVLAGG